SRGGITLTGGENVAINSADDPNHLLTATRVGDIQITALNGDITMGDSTTMSTKGGNIIALASGDVVGGTGMTLTAYPPKSHGNGHGNGNGNSGGGGGIHIGAGLTSSNELVGLLQGQPAPFTTSPNPLPNIGATVTNNGTGLVKVLPTDGAGIS